ncbi:MAG: hypothetical protein L0G63_05320 [Psychrobacter sp.]|uniref:hypothetical protein n=1 Tax=Psychrobacter sp. TaxID=56811 RepID=UPI0026487211|nr:hypothetical protein [Psychrobacter sp.]MDN5619897.1 hypothetical protein [Psychrobacter sp.]
MRQSHKFLATLDNSFYSRYLQQMLVMVGVLLFFMFSRQALANPFATPDNFDAASCPIGHKKYTIANTASTAPSLSSWVNGERSRTFIFNESSGNKTFTINFPLLIDANNRDGTVPFYGSNNGVSSNAINLVHNSTQVQTDHTLDVSINRPVSKVGYKIQDLDSTTVRVRVGGIFFPRYEDRAPYIEQVDVSANNGRLTFNSIFHNINPQRNIVTAKEGENCSTGQCTIDATWGYQIANKALNLAHSNEKRETSGVHATGYSDFYFCLAPPKIIVNKLLDGSRVDGDDQFRIELRRTDNNDFVEAFTTTGSNDVVTDNTTTVTTLTEGVNYTVSEQIINGNLLDYQTTYTCSNATTGTDVVFSSGEMPVNADGTRRTFAINNVSYGDEITCNVTNTPSQYTFSGIVFNDNGGLSGSPKNDLTNSFINTYKYFNGVFDNGESGIDGSALNNLKVKLTDCNSTDITGTTHQNVSDTGSYSFTVPASAVAGKSQICLIQEEPDPWSYSVDTTPNRLEVPINNSVYLYEDNNFGEVIAEQTALVLKKYQYVHQCDTNLNYNNILDKDSPLNGFSINAPRQDEKVDPGQCIAYKIEAYNHGHITLTDIRITDILQKTPVESVFHLPNSSGIAASLRTTKDLNSGLVNIGDNGVIITEPFKLTNTATTTIPSKATLYFNTKYGN